MSEKILFSMRIDPDLRREFKAEAASRGESMSDVIEGAIRSYLYSDGRYKAVNIEKDHFDSLNEMLAVLRDNGSPFGFNSVDEVFQYLAGRTVSNSTENLDPVLQQISDGARKSGVNND